MGRIYAKPIVADKLASSHEGLFRAKEDLGKIYYRHDYVKNAGNSCFIYVYRPKA